MKVEPALPWLPATPQWAGEGLDLTLNVAEAALILVVAWLLNRLLSGAVRRLCTRWDIPPEFTIGARRLLGTVLYVSALVLILRRMGVSGSVLWTALTGFIAVAAVAFFAAWSVLSNIFCALLIVTTRPFRLHDEIELLEDGEKPGLKGRVVDINFVYTTLQEADTNGGYGHGSLLQIPNTQFFQKVTRRWAE
jgi:small-conductance mechanosensitive channel